MTYTSIETEIQGGAGIVRIHRPEAMNALNAVVMEEATNALEAFDADSRVGAMVLAGDARAFAAGADIKEMAEASSVDMLVSDRIGRWDRLRRLHKPVIAAVSGWCLGGGNELAMACDMIVASETARFGQPEINLGVMPGAGGTQRLTPRRRQGGGHGNGAEQSDADGAGGPPMGVGQPRRPGGGVPGGGGAAGQRDRRAGPPGGSPGEGSRPARLRIRSWSTVWPMSAVRSTSCSARRIRKKACRRSWPSASRSGRAADPGA